MGEHTKRTAFIFVFRKHVIECHEKAYILERGPTVYATGPINDLGVGLGPYGQWIIHHQYRTETRRGCASEVGLGHHDCCRVRAPDSVVKVEVKLGQFLLCVRKVFEPRSNRFGPFIDTSSRGGFG